MWMSLEQLKQTLSVQTDQYDDLLVRLADAVERRIEAFCRRDFDLQWYNESFILDESQDRIYLSNYPVVDVAAITVSDTAVDLSDIEVLSDEGVLYQSGGFTAGRAVANVCYCAGFSPIPNDLLTVLVDEVHDAFHRWTESQDERIISERLGEYSYRRVFVRGGWRPSSVGVLEYYRKAMS